MRYELKYIYTQSNSQPIFATHPGRVAAVAVRMSDLHQLAERAAADVVRPSILPQMHHIVAEVRLRHTLLPRIIAHKACVLGVPYSHPDARIRAVPSTISTCPRVICFRTIIRVAKSSRSAAPARTVRSAARCWCRHSKWMPIWCSAPSHRR